MRAFIQRHVVVSYFVLTFVISWGGILVVMATAHTGLIASQQEFTRLIPIWSPLLVLGPSVSAIVVTGLASGGSGLRAYGSRLARLSVSWRWYAAALLMGPVCYLATSLALATFSRTYLPAIVTAADKPALLAQGVPVALLAGVFEELGWTGLAVPALRRHHSPVKTGLIVGVVWGLWHFLPKLFGAEVGGAGLRFFPVDMLCGIVGLTGYRVIMVWIYDRTRSIPIGMLAHAALTGSMMIIQPLVTGAQFARMVVALAVTPWLAVAAIALVGAARARRGRRGVTPAEARRPSSPASAAAAPARASLH